MCVHYNCLHTERERELIHIHVKSIWTVVDGFRFMCIHIAFGAVKGERDCLFGMCAVYTLCIYESLVLTRQLVGKSF
jgi:hypothetical protein